MSSNPFGVRGQRDPAEFVEWNSRNRRAREAYFSRTYEPPLTALCACGAKYPTARGLEIHRSQYCELREDKS